MPGPTQNGQIEAYIRRMQSAAIAQQEQIKQLAAEVAALKNGPRSPDDEINAIPGRRVFYTFQGTQTFDTSSSANQAGTSSPTPQRGAAINFAVSQDGPFVMTHYPVAMWYPTLPANATNINAWQPLMYGLLPTQSIANLDFVHISYEVADSGAGRQMQNAAVGAGLLSHPTDMIPLPAKTVFAPNTTIQFIPTYNLIFFNQSAATKTTQGTLVVMLPGYKIVNGP